MNAATKRSRAPEIAGYAMVAAAACMWGTWPLFLRNAARFGELTPAFESAFVMLVMTVATAPLVLRDRVRVRATMRDWAGIGWLGFADAMNVALFFAAYHATSVAVAVLSHYLAPIFVALAAPLLLGERARTRTFVAMFVSFAGLVLLLSPWSAGARGSLVGALLGGGSAFFYASNVVVNKRLVPVFSGSELMLFHGLVATPLLFLAVPSGAWAHLDARACGIVLAGALFPGTLAGLLFVWGLRRIPASHASTLTLLEPLVAVVVGAAWYDEKLGASAILGGGMILAGAFAVVWRARENGPTVAL